MSSQGSFSHLDPQGSAHMVDVSEKPVTRRVAEASCRVLLSAQTLIRLANLPKGDAFAVARLAGIQGAKRTAELIPLAHPLPLDQVEVDLQPIPDGIEIRSRVVVTGRTGAEMEAMIACSTAALALYDMVKSLERGVVMTDLRLEVEERRQERLLQKKMTRIQTGLDRLLADPDAPRRPALRPAGPRRLHHRRRPPHPPRAGGEPGGRAARALRSRARLLRHRAGHGRRRRRQRSLDGRADRVALRRLGAHAEAVAVRASTGSTCW